mgnify:CR=1 FL=1
MKKFFIFLLAIIGISFTAYADNYDTCRVTGAGYGDTVTVSVIDYDDETVTVNIASDCDEWITVTFTIQRGSGGSNFNTNTFSASAQPNSNITKTYRLPKPGNEKPSFDVSISGARCE